ncbi:AraC family transcriptional regulator [Zhongshania aliphaticivorans]|nr:AraC family transcriptional regulator [Zhongshania aliphaticivorans]
MKPKYHSAKTILSPLSRLREEGISVGQALTGTGLSLSILNKPEQHVSLSQELMFLRNLRKATANPAIGLKVGSCYPLSLFGIYGYALMSAATVSDALKLAYEYVELSFAFLEHSLSFRGSNVVMSMSSDDYSADDISMLNEREMTATLMILRGLIGEDFSLHSVSMRHSQQAPLMEYKKYFDCPIHFDAEENTLVFSAELINTPVLQCDSETANLCIDRCERLKARLTEEYNIVDEVREQILLRPGYFPNIEELAQKLNMSGRTLRRKLSSHGSGYQKILDSLRLELSREYLYSTKISVEQVSILLGYSDPAHFSHAFRRWAGVSPSDFRAAFMLQSR